MTVTKLTENWTVDIFIAEDGTRHRDEHTALRYEQDRSDYALTDGLKSMTLGVPVLRYMGLVDETFYLIRNVAERDAVIRKFCQYAQYTYINDKFEGKAKDISIGDWIVRTYQYDDGERSHKGVYTLSWLLNEFNSFADTVNKITVEGKY